MVIIGSSTVRYVMVTLYVDYMYHYSTVCNGNIIWNHRYHYSTVCNGNIIW